MQKRFFLIFGYIKKKTGIKYLSFSLSKRFSYLGIFGTIEVSKCEVKAMKYTPSKDTSLLYGKDQFIYRTEETDKRIDIFLKSSVHSCKCPFCGMESSALHATYERTLQDIPIRCKPTYVHANVFKYDCENPGCGHKVFMEPLPFASASQVRTDSLNALVLAMAMFMSNEGASTVLSLMGVTISNDTIQRLYDRIEFKDDPDVEAVGIDDVATRKGQKYATAIYDLKDHHMIALLDGRDGATLKEWLKDHKKIRLVARDRASAYASAINEVLPECTQVADRFHLLQNLLDRLKDIFKDEVPSTIFIRGGAVLDKAPGKEVRERAFDAKRLDGVSYDNSPPVDEHGSEIEFKSKKRNLDSKQYKKNAESRKKNSS